MVLASRRPSGPAWRWAQQRRIAAATGMAIPLITGMVTPSLTTATVVVVAGALPMRLTADTGLTATPAVEPLFAVATRRRRAGCGHREHLSPAAIARRLREPAARSSLTIGAITDARLYGRYAGLTSLRRKPGAVDTMQRLFAVF
jgi:hypothetical protein